MCSHIQSTIVTRYDRETIKISLMTSLLRNQKNYLHLTEIYPTWHLSAFFWSPIYLPLFSLNIIHFSRMSWRSAVFPVCSNGRTTNLRRRYPYRRKRSGKVRRGLLLHSKYVFIWRQVLHQEEMPMFFRRNNYKAGKRCHERLSNLHLHWRKNCVPRGRYLICVYESRVDRVDNWQSCSLHLFQKKRDKYKSFL